jgi:hypothetical protein
MTRIFDADTEGYVSAYIIAPSTIYDTGDGPVNRISQQVPTLIKESLKEKQAVYVGEGTNHWNNVCTSLLSSTAGLIYILLQVHVADLVDLYTLILNLAVTSLVPAAPQDSYSKFFWGSVGEHVWGDISREIGKILFAKGIVSTPEAKSIPPRPDLMYVSFLLQ